MKDTEKLIESIKKDFSTRSDYSGTPFILKLTKSNGDIQIMEVYDEELYKQMIEHLSGNSQKGKNIVTT
jgi:hypothetical protein